MTESENLELEALCDRLRLVEKRQWRRTIATMSAIGTIAVFALAIPVAFSAPPSPTPCSHGDLFCFGAGEPARAAEVNSNFETLHGITDALTTNANGRLSQSGGTVTGALTANAGLTVNGGLSVAGGLPITVSEEYIASAGLIPIPTVSMTPKSRSLCFVQRTVSAILPSGAATAAPNCAITDANGTWYLTVTLAPTASSSACMARCISW